MSLERCQDVAVGKSREAVQKAQAGDAAESFHHLWMQRVVKVEQKASITRESIREQHPAGAQFVLGVVRPRTFLADRCRRDDGSVPITMLREIDDGKKVAVLAIFISGPGEHVSRWQRFRAVERRRCGSRTGEDGGDDERGLNTAEQELGHGTVGNGESSQRRSGNAMTYNSAMKSSPEYAVNDFGSTGCGSGRMSAHVDGRIADSYRRNSLS